MAFADAVSRMDATIMLAFGVSATLDGAPVVGIFDSPYSEAYGVATRAPSFRVRDGMGPTQASQLTIPSGPGAGTWRVRSIEPDGTGMTVLGLEKLT